MPESVAPFYEGWRKANARLVQGIRPLSDAQLRFTPSESASPIWTSAAHIAGTRVYWLCGVFKEPGAETTPFTDPLADMGWEDDLAHPRSAIELVGALESSWAIVEGALERWTPSMLAEEFTRMRSGKVQRHTRQSVLLRMITHDAFHSGEISYLLGMQGLLAIDLWAPEWPLPAGP
jgi:uncharacterized damage-inducible protein DinB